MDYVTSLEKQNLSLQNKLTELSESVHEMMKINIPETILYKDLVLDMLYKNMRVHDKDFNTTKPEEYFNNIVLNTKPEEIVHNFWGQTPLSSITLRTSVSKAPVEVINAFQAYMVNVLIEYRTLLENSK